MQLPHRPPMSPEEIELIKAKTRGINIVTWLTSLNLGLALLLVGIPACLTCVGCLLALVMIGAIAVSIPPIE